MPARSGSGAADVDWRRLASDRNIPHAVARELWDRAQDASPGDAELAARTFERLLDGAAAANATAAPGRETLVEAKAPDDASSLGPGKWTRVLETKRPADKNSLDGLYADLASAIRAGKRAAVVLATSGQETLAEALREIRQGEGNGTIEKIVNAAGDAIERIIDARAPAAATTTGAPAESAPVAAEGAPVTTAPDSESR